MGTETKMVGRRSGRRLLISLGILLCLSLAAAGMVHALEEEGEVRGLDVVFLVDQSGSMGGEKYGSTDHPISNDPHDLRFAGMQELIDRLGSYRTTYYHGSDVRFQAAVVYFGSVISRTVEPVIIDHDTTDEWTPLAEELTKALSADAMQGKNLGNTDHSAAFVEAKAILDRMKESWEDGNRHRQAILLLTDGESYVACPEPPEQPEGEQPAEPPADQPEYCQDGTFLTYRYRQMMRDYVSNELPYPRYLIYMAAINADMAELPQFWKDLTNDHAELVDANTMWAFFDNTLAALTVNDEDLKELKTEEGDVRRIGETEDQVAVPPYLQKLTFIVHKPAPDVRVKLYQDGALLEDLPSTTAKDKDKYIETIEMRNPQPGYIILERPVTTSVVNILMMQLRAKFDCDELGDLPQYIPAPLRCQISGEDGSLPAYSDSRYALVVQAELRGQGQVERVELVPQGGGTYSTFFIPVTPGDFTYHVTTSTHDPDDKEIGPFREPSFGEGHYTVRPSTPALQVDASPIALLPIPMTVRLKNAETGVDLPVPRGAERYVQMELQARADGVQTEIPLAAGAGGYHGTFLPLQPLSYQILLRGLVEDPETGDRLPVFNEKLGVVDVSEPEVVWTGFSTPWPQYRPADVAFHLADRAGTRIGESIDPALELQVEVKIVSDDDESLPPTAVEVVEVETGGWQGELKPEVAGAYTAYGSVFVQDESGAAVKVLSDERLFQYTVDSMTLVLPEIASPASGAEHPWRDILWRIRPLPVEIAVVDEDGNLLDPAQIQENQRSSTLAASIEPPGAGEGSPLSLAKGEKAGEFVASFEEYKPFAWHAHRDLGWHQVQVQPKAVLDQTHIWAAEAGESARVRFVRHPLWWLAPAVLALIAVAGTAWAVWEVYLHMWSAVGTLRITGARPSFARRLSDLGRHTVVFGRRSGLPAGVRKIKVQQPRGRGPKVSVQLKNGAWALREELSDGALKLLGGDLQLSYTLGRSEKAPEGFAPGWRTILLALLALVMLAALGLVAFAIITSLR